MPSACSQHIAIPTNVGAIFRLAAALGVDAVLVSPRCGDPLYRRSVRVGMGTVIPMRAGVDSLNVAAASAVAFWELRPRD